MEEKGTIKIGLSGFFLILAIIAIIIMGFFMFKFYNDKQKAEEKVETLNSDATKLQSTINSIQSTINNTSNELKNNINTNSKEFTVPSLYTSSMKNPSKNALYSLPLNTAYCSITIENGIPYISWYSEVDNFIQELANQNKVKLTTEKQKIKNLTKNVVDIHFGGIGQDGLSSVFIFLMEDGTLAYSTIENMIKNTSSQGIIDGLTNIIKIQNVSVSYGEGGGHASIIAIDKDNNSFDLHDYIQK